MMNYEMHKLDFTFEGLCPQLLTTLFIKANLIKSTDQVVEYKETSVGDNKGFSGTLLLISDIQLDSGSTLNKNEFFIKIAGRSGGYQKDYESYFYSNCLHDSPLFIEFYGTFEFKNSNSLLIMDYFRNGICFDRNDGLTLPFTLISIKNLVSLALKQLH